MMLASFRTNGVSGGFQVTGVTHRVLDLHKASVTVEVPEPVQDSTGGVTDEGPGHHAVPLHQEAGILQHQLSDGQPHGLHTDDVHL